MKTFKELFIYLFTNAYLKNKCEMFNQSLTETFSRVSFDGFLELTGGYISLLQSLNLNCGDRVAIIAKSCTDWIAADFAIMTSGLVSVPIFTNASDSNFAFEIDESSPEVFFVESYQTKQRLINMRIDSKKIFYFNNVKPIKLVNIIESVNKFKSSPNSLASVVYTSGTTGTPQGVMISQYNLISQILNASRVFDVNKNDVAISFLPTAHIFQRMICYLYIYRQVNVYFINDHNTLINNFKIINPTLLTTVPRVLEKAYIAVNKSMNSKKAILKILLSFIRKYANSKNPNKKNSFIDKIISKILQKLIFVKILALFGNRMRMIICGGAKLNDEVYRFFLNIGLPLYQGYGMTEMSPVIAANNPSFNKCYTVGKFFDNIVYQVAEDGELLVRGDNLMLGYYNNKNETEKHFTNGFFATGDIVEIDQDGFLTVKSRKKELFKTSNGKYIDPTKIEFLISKCGIIDYSCVIADGYKFVSAILFAKNVNYSDIEKIIVKINEGLEEHERIIKFHITDDFISPETGELTPSLKLRRFIIYEKYQNQIKDFYS